MDRQKFLKTVFHRTLMIAVYLLILLLLLSLFFHMITEGIRNESIQLVILLAATAVIAVLSLIYLKHRFYPTVPPDPMALSKELWLFIDKLTNTLHASGEREELKAKIGAVFDEHRGMGYPGPLYAIKLDMTCHLGLFDSHRQDFRFRDRNFSFQEGIDHFKEQLKAMLRSKRVRVYDPIYEIYTRWIYFKEEKIEVDILDLSERNYVFRDIQADDYYLEIAFDSGHASWEELFKVEDSAVKTALKNALQNGDKAGIKRITTHFENEYLAQRNKRAV